MARDLVDGALTMAVDDGAGRAVVVPVALEFAVVAARALEMAAGERPTAAKRAGLPPVTNEAYSKASRSSSAS